MNKKAYKKVNVNKMLKEMQEREEFRKQLVRGVGITYTINDVELLQDSSSIKEAFNLAITVESCKTLFNTVKNGRYTPSFCQAFAQLCWALAASKNGNSLRASSFSACTTLNNYMITTPRGLQFTDSVVAYIFDNHLTNEKLNKVVSTLNSRFDTFSKKIKLIQKNIEKVRGEGSLDENAVELRYFNDELKFLPK